MVEVGKIEEILKREVVEEYTNVFLGEEPESIERAVEILFDPSNEGYSTSYANVVENTVREITGRPIVCWPLEDASLLLTEKERFLGVVDDGLPSDFEYLKSVVKDVLKVIEEKKSLNYYELGDEEGTYGIVATPLSKKEFEKLVEEYKATDEYYNNEDLIEFLKEKGIKAELIEPEEVYF